MVWSLVHVTDHVVFLQYSASICNRGGDTAHTVNLPILVHSSSCCWWYFLVNFMNSLVPDLLLNLSHFWPMRGLILTVSHLLSYLPAPSYLPLCPLPFLCVIVLISWTCPPSLTVMFSPFLAAMSQKMGRKG